MQEIFEQVLGKENVLRNEPMSHHTTFKIGGTADWFLTPRTEEQLSEVLKLLHKNNLSFFVLGNGSNLLVGDKGIRGVVLCLCKKMERIEACGDEIYAEAGAILSRVSNVALAAGLEGTEFSSGIPGTVGGAVYMNAGAYEHEMKEIIKSVRYMDMTGKIFESDCEECSFGYRTSKFSKGDYIILGCTLKLRKGNSEEIRTRIADYTQRRVSKQPLEKPSAGSTFKRPEGHFAGGLIEKAGLKGYSIGGAQVSEKHAGFVINTGTATAKDVLDLIEFIKKTVFEKFGVELEPEVKLIGEF
ncbi:MAG: UDP-N-acetylmuramate dehydrogenase [Ruminococcaceae bacterium]|nr:UDP-N-acetylmuramate dehydrogenase [Oscillospiraceae bacterium]